jgi:hypothetical protein
LTWISRNRFQTTLLAMVAASACGPKAPPAVSPEPTPGGAVPASDPDPAALAAQLQRATQPGSPRQITFGWALDEAGAGFRGRGAGRYVAPSRFRIDLFGPNGESYLSAALVDGQLRIPPVVEQRFRLPSPALLWAAAGIFAPPAEARLTAGRIENGVLTLRYDVPDQGMLEFRARDNAIVSVRRLRAGGVQESVDLERSEDGALRQARYRDWPAFRTLTLTQESSTDVTGFPDEIWAPPGTRP